MDFKGLYFNLWECAWEYHKKWCINSGSDDEWQGIVDESADILKEYEGKPQYDFMKSLLLAVVGELERIDRERRKESANNEHGKLE